MEKELAVLALLAVNAWTDVRKREISLISVLLFAAGGVTFRAFGDGFTVRLLYSMLPGLLFGVIHLAAKNSVGMGDVLILGVLGLVLEPEEILRLFVPGVLFCGGTAAFLLLRGKAGQKDSIPFVPFLLCGDVGGLML